MPSKAKEKSPPMQQRAEASCTVSAPTETTPTPPSTIAREYSSWPKAELPLIVVASTESLGTFAASSRNVTVHLLEYSVQRRIAGWAVWQEVGWYRVGHGILARKFGVRFASVVCTEGALGDGNEVSVFHLRYNTKYIFTTKYRGRVQTH